MAQPHNFKSGLMTIRDAEKLNELQKWIDNRRVALAIPSNEFNPAYKFQAKITAYSSDDYTWTRQSFDVDGEYIDDPVPYSGGPSDMPAKERNGKVAVDFPFYAELTFRVNVQGSPYYEFDYTTVDRITIKEVDGSPSVLAKTLELPNSAMSNPSAGVARLLEASSTTGGTVTTGTQEIAGAKEWLADAQFNATIYQRELGEAGSGDVASVYVENNSSGADGSLWHFEFYHDAFDNGAFKAYLNSTPDADMAPGGGLTVVASEFLSYYHSVYRLISGTLYSQRLQGQTGFLGPGCEAVGGVIVDTGSGSFFDGDAANLTGTLDGGAF